MHRKILKGLVWIIMPLVLALFFNQSSFWHYHVLQNGMVIEHSHPFKSETTPGTPYQNHKHSDFNYLLLAQISLVITLVSVVLALVLWAQPKAIFSLSKPTQVYLKGHEFSSRLLRAPPMA